MTSASEERADESAASPALIVVEGSSLRTVRPSVSEVGLKALGLARLPIPWRPEFFVVSARKRPDLAAIIDAGRCIGLRPDDEVLVRSSGTLEGMGQRGALDSSPCVLRGVPDAISVLQERFSEEGAAENQVIHFVVQKRLGVRAKGHLSNERRLSRQPRDWVAEIEATRGFPGETHSVALRKWRDAAEASTTELSCPNRAVIPRALQEVAKWAHIKGSRFHLEWVWDGARIWVVQQDACIERSDGVVPRSLVVSAPKSPPPRGLKNFSPATTADYVRYRKLKNVAIYAELGYEMPPFFILNDQVEIGSIRSGEPLSKDLRNDLRILTEAPFVLRTDAVGIPDNQRQMLSRSDELRSGEAAEKWLELDFIHDIYALPNNSELALIGHHFIPATASAWCLAYPDRRRVRIESLWGIPEGLYWYAHDVYDVDTADVDVSKGMKDKCRVLAKRERYKDRFVAPDSEGNWVVHNTSVGPDWQGSITRADWIREIAWTSRLIATREGRPVVVMWFIDVAKSASPHKVLPWHHEEWKPTSAAQPSVSPRKKRATSSERVIATRADWDALKGAVSAGENVERVAILPEEGDIVRERQFLGEIARHAREHGYVVELRGGLLSHAFYLLTDAGCEVECVDLFATDEEELQFNKLVRDKIPEEIERRGESAEVVKLVGDALLEALKRKLVEEALEVSDAKTSADIVEEIADLHEVTGALMQALSVGQDEVGQARDRKRIRRGGFLEGLMLLRTSLGSSVTAAPLLATAQVAQQLISRAEDLPPAVEEDFHLDMRADSARTLERQFTFTIPASAKSFRAGRHTFGLPTPAGSQHEMQIEVSVERHGAELRLRLRLINAMHQLELQLERG